MRDWKKEIGGNNLSYKIQSPAYVYRRAGSHGEKPIFSIYSRLLTCRGTGPRRLPRRAFGLLGCGLPHPDIRRYWCPAPGPCRCPRANQSLLTRCPCRRGCRRRLSTGQPYDYPAFREGTRKQDCFRCLEYLFLR